MDNRKFLTNADAHARAVLKTYKLTEQEDALASNLSTVLAKKVMIVYSETVKNMAPIGQHCMSSVFALCLRPFTDEATVQKLQPETLTKPEDAFATKTSELISKETDEFFRGKPEMRAEARFATYAYALIAVDALVQQNRDDKRKEQN